MRTKQILCLTVVFFALGSFARVHAGYSLEYTFACDLLTALHQCRSAMDSIPQKDVDPVTTMPAYIMQNRRLQAAKKLLWPYLGNSNTLIAGVADSVSTGIISLIDANNKILHTMKGASKLEANALKDLKYRCAQISLEKKRTWKRLAWSASFVVLAFAKSTKTDRLAGPIPYKISETERKSLLRHIDQLFGEDLQQYHQHRRVTNEELQGSSHERTWLLFAIHHIKKQLSARTYEQLAKLSKSEDLHRPTRSHVQKPRKPLEAPVTKVLYRVTYSDGSKYIGEWKENKRHGQGTYTWPNGVKYVGEFKEGKAVGGWLYRRGGNRVWVYQDSHGNWVVDRTARQN